MRKTLVSFAMLGVLAPTGIAAMTTTATSAPVTHTQGSAQFVSHSASQSPASARVARGGLTLRQYWTPARMKAAKSLDNITAKGTPQKTTQVPASTGVVKSVKPAAGSLPVTESSGRRGRLTRPYTSRIERTNAKVFFTQDGYDYVCSGTIVNSDTKNMVNTAGHCVASEYTGEWSENMIVVPAYSSRCDGCGNAPYGVWTGKQWTTTTSWIDYADLLNDYGYIILKKHERHNIVKELGGRGIVWNLDYYQTFRGMGYPQASPFDGYNQVKRKGSTLWLDGDGSEDYAMAMESGLTGGSSGGAWDVAYSGAQYVNGHNDYVYTSAPDVMYSPYYGDTENSLYWYTVGLG